jgi:hypothetical protein
LIQACRTVAEIDELARSNAVPLNDLRALAPRLCNSEGIHFADLLLRLIQRARHRLSGPVPGAAEFADEAGAGIRKFPVPEEDFVRASVFAPILLGPSKDMTCAPENPTAELPPHPASISFSVKLAEEGRGMAFSPIFAGEVLPNIPSPQIQESPKVPANGTTNPEAPLAPSKIAAGPRIDKSRLAMGSERRIRDKIYLKQIGELPCTVCGRQPSHAHHLRFAQTRGLSQKVSDEYVVPLCGLHHGDLHRYSDETRWWKTHKINPISIAAGLWARYCGLTS